MPAAAMTVREPRCSGPGRFPVAVMWTFLYRVCYNMSVINEGNQDSYPFVLYGKERFLF